MLSAAIEGRTLEDDDAFAGGMEDQAERPPKLRRTATLEKEEETATGQLRRAAELRARYQQPGNASTLRDALAAGKRLTHRFDSSGLLELIDSESELGDAAIVASCAIDVASFARDYAALVKIVSNGHCRTFCHQRLEILQHRFELHETEQGDMEMRAMGSGEMASVDFYKCGKVDNHIHLAAAFNAQNFSKYVREKLATEGETIVAHDGGVPKSLRQLFTESGLDESHLGLDAFHVLADHSLFQRFDRFNDRYNPWRKSRMRTIFLKSSNAIGGRYFGELTRALLDRFERKYDATQTVTELRVSIYGVDGDEWARLAAWVLSPWQGAEGREPRTLLSHCNRWIVQIPRLYALFRGKRGADGQPQVKHYQEMLEHIFGPLVEATLAPEAHPQLAELLEHVVAFDSVDDESNPEQPVDATPACCWRREEQPNYSWQLFMLFGSLRTLNMLRAAKGLNTIALRPHCGESGDPSHLAGAYLCAASVNHGIKLSDSAVLQYLFYVDQVGLSLSPISNHFLFRKAKDSPFPKFFKRGLNVTLSTDDPMLFHLSEDALLEEYTHARIAYDLSMLDMCELARNSVVQSGFDDARKRSWLGERYADGAQGCEPCKCNVTPSRASFRTRLLHGELALVGLRVKAPPRA